MVSENTQGGTEFEFPAEWRQDGIIFLNAIIPLHLAENKYKT